MGRVLALLVTGGLIGACSGGGAPAASVPSSAAATAPAPDTTALEPVEEASDRTGESLPSGRAAVDDAIAEYGDGSVEATLARWAALSGPLPSLPDPLRSDITPSLTEVLNDYPTVRAHLDPADAAVIDDRIEEFLDADFSFDLDVSGLELDAAVADTQTLPDDPEGFKRAGLVRQSPGDDLDDDDFIEGTRDAWVAATRRAATLFGRNLPGVPSLRVKVVVTQPSFWVKSAGPGESIAEPGGGTLFAARGGYLVEELRARYDTDGQADCFLITARDGRGPTASAAAIGMLTHELFHCWHFNRVGKSLDAFDGAQKWISEGLAGWVGETLAGGSYYTNLWLPLFVANPFPVFANDYEAYGFWGRINESTNLWSVIPGLVDTSASSSAAVYDQALAAIPSASAFISAGALQEGGLGGEWTTEEWMPSGFERTPADGTAGVGDPAERSAGAGVQRADRIAVSASEGDVLLLDADGFVAVVDETGELDLAAFDESVQLDICIISCVCPATGEPRPTDVTIDVADPTLFAALAGRSAGPSTLAVEVVGAEEAIEEECEEREPEAGDDGAGLLGTWRANPESIAAMYEQASAFGDDAIPLEVSAASGDLTLTFLTGGKGELIYDRVTLSIEDAASQEIRLDGSGTFQWAPGAGGIEITGTTFAISVSSSALGDNFITLTDADVPGGGTTTLRVFPEDNRLTITSVEGSAGRVFFPVSWIRQS